MIKTKKIAIIEKELESGFHTSGRNSGVLHAGIYYQENSLKASVCIKGARRLKKWINENDISINNCGKIIVAQNETDLKNVRKIFSLKTYSSNFQYSKSFF